MPQRTTTATPRTERAMRERFVLYGTPTSISHLPESQYVPANMVKKNIQNMVMNKAENSLPLIFLPNRTRALDSARRHGKMKCLFVFSGRALCPYIKLL